MLTRVRSFFLSLPSWYACSSYPMADLMASLTRLSHSPSGFNYASSSYFNCTSLLDVSVLQKLTSTSRAIFSLSLRFMSVITFNYFCHTALISESFLRWLFILCRLCSISRTYINKLLFDSIFLRLHWINSSKNTQLTICSCYSLYLLCLQESTASDLLSFGELITLTFNILRISLKVGLPNGSAFSIEESIFWVVLDNPLSCGKCRALRLISLLKAAIDFEDHGHTPNKHS